MKFSSRDCKVKGENFSYVYGRCFQEVSSWCLFPKYGQAYFGPVPGRDTKKIVNHINNRWRKTYYKRSGFAPRPGKDTKNTQINTQWMEEKYHKTVIHGIIHL